MKICNKNEIVCVWCVIIKINIMEVEPQLFNIDGKEVVLNTITENDIVYYKVIDLAYVLSIVNGNAMISDVHETNKKMFLTEKINILGKKIGGKQKTLFITLESVKILLLKSRSVRANELAKQLGINVLTRIIPYECETLQTIMDVFNGEKMISQYYVNGYRIDLYFVEYRLAIECDETHHKTRKTYDVERQEQIETQLNCKFIRYNPCQPNFNINITLNQIFRHIKIFETCIN